MVISSEAYDMLTEDETLSATSGKDILGISKGDEENTYVIYFSDSAIVSRAISRGYITVNGTRIDLSEETMKQLSETDKQAEEDRLQAFNQFVMEHDMAVAQQQSESLQKAAVDEFKALKIVAKLLQGGKVPIEGAQVEWNTYETQMTVSLADGVDVKCISECGFINWAR